MRGNSLRPPCSFMTLRNSPYMTGRAMDKMIESMLFTDGMHACLKAYSVAVASTLWIPTVMDRKRRKSGMNVRTEF